MQSAAPHDEKPESVAYEQLYYVQCDGWLNAALFAKDRLVALASESNLRRALRDPLGTGAALMSIGEFPTLVELTLPRLWQARNAALAASRKSLT